MRKGIILAGGAGTRLHPLTISVSKQLLPIYNKPTIMYPLQTLVSMGIKDILIITTPRDKDLFINLLGNGYNFGVNLFYEVQSEPKGIAQAFLIGKKFIGDDDVCLILGDNIFFGIDDLLKSASHNDGATILGIEVKNPSLYGVIEFGHAGRVQGIEEKPKVPKSNYAVPGIYFYPNDVIGKAETIEPSKRGELEITDINNIYIRDNRMKVFTQSKNFTWFDTGDFDSLFGAAEYVKNYENKRI